MKLILILEWQCKKMTIMLLEHVIRQVKETGWAEKLVFVLFVGKK